MSEPLQLLLAGVVVSLVGAGLGWMGLDSDTTGVVILAWVALSVGGLLAFVGLVSCAVEIGVRSARR